MEFRVVFGSYYFSQYSERKKKSVTFVRVVDEGSQPSVMSIWNVSAISSTTVEEIWKRSHLETTNEEWTIGYFILYIACYDGFSDFAPVSFIYPSLCQVYCNLWNVGENQLSKTNLSSCLIVILFSVFVAW